MSNNIATLGILVDSSAVKKATADLDKLTQTGQRTEQTTGQVTRATDKLAVSMDKMGNTVNRAYQFFVGYLGISSAKKLLEQADAWKLIEGRLRIVTDSENQLIATRQRLLEITSKTRADFSATADLYTKVAMSAKELGRTENELFSLTEIVQQAIKVSGADAAAASGGVRQFSQALASGVLRGDELNSVMENMPRLARAIAQGMGVTMGKLREMGAAGQLSADQIIKAVLSQKDVIDREFGKMPKTIGDSMNAVSTSFLQFVGNMDKATGLSTIFSGALGAVASGFDFLRDSMSYVDKIFTTLAFATFPILIAKVWEAGRAIAAFNAFQLATGGVATSMATGILPPLARGFLSVKSAIMGAITGVRAFTVALASNPLGLIAVAISTVVGLLYSFRNSIYPIEGSIANLRDFTVAAFQIIGDGISKVFGGIKSVFTGVIDFFMSGWTKLKEFVKGFGEGVYSSLSSALSAVPGMLKSLVNFTLNTLEVMLTGWWVLGRSIVQMYITTFQSVKGYAVAFGKDLMNVFKGNVSFSNLGAEMGKGFNTGFSQAMVDMGGKIKEIYSQDKVGAVGEALKGAGSYWKQVAENVHATDEAMASMMNNTKQQSAELANMQKVATETNQGQAQQKNSELVQKATADASAYRDIWRSAGANMESTMSGALSKTFESGKLDFTSMVQSIKKIWFDMIAQLIIRWLIVKALSGTSVGSALFGLPGAGGAGDAAKVVPTNTGSSIMHASGGVVERATPFLDGQGRSHVMGEAGAEAILPLGRTKGGDLGVRMIGGGQQGGGNNVAITNSIAVTIQTDSNDPNKHGEIAAEMINKAIEMKINEKFLDYNRPGGMASKFRNA